LILTSSGVSTVPLTELTVDAVRDHAVAFLAALEEVADPARERPRAACEQDLADVLAWLWDVIAAPVLARLGPRADGRDGTGPPRVWWCPTGLLSLLPLHAAGSYSGDGENTGSSVLDRVVPSYTATVRALLHARQAPACPRGDDARILAVCM